MFDLNVDSSAANDGNGSALVLEYGNTDSRRFVSSQEELARRLGVSRRTITLWRAREGCPKPRANGQYEVAQWEAFARENELKLDADAGNTAGAIKLRRAQIAEERERLLLEKLRGTLVSAEEVAETWSASAEKIFTEIVWKAASAFEACGIAPAMAHANAEKLANDVFREFRLSLQSTDSAPISSYGDCQSKPQ